MNTIERLADDFRRLRSDADFWSLRSIEERAENLSVRKNVVQPPVLSNDCGAMLTAYAAGGCGYAATADLSPAGLQTALDRAVEWACATAARSLIDFRTLPKPAPRGSYASPDADKQSWSSGAWYDLLAEESRQAGSDSRIVDWEASVETRTAEHCYLTSAGGEVVQRYRFVMPSLSVTAHAHGDTQTRSLNGYRGLRSKAERASSGASILRARDDASPMRLCNCSPRPTVLPGRWIY